MDHPTNHPEFSGLTAERTAENIQRDHAMLLQLQLHSMQMQVQDHRHFHDAILDIDLTQKILANEEAATYFDNDEAHPHLAKERQELLLNSAVLLVHDRGVLPVELRKASIDDCIQKYNAIEQQKDRDDETAPQLIGYQDVSEKYQQLFAEAQERKRNARKGHWLLSKFAR